MTPGRVSFTLAAAAVVLAALFGVVGLAFSGRSPFLALLPALPCLMLLGVVCFSGALSGRLWAVGLLWMAVLVIFAIRLGGLDDAVDQGAPAATLAPQPVVVHSMAGSLQQVLKFGLLLTGFLAGVMHLPQIKPLLTQTRTVLLLGYAGWLWLTIPMSDNMPYSAGSAFAFLALVVLTALVCTRLDRGEILVVLFLSSVVIIALNWFAYLFVPSVGRLQAVGPARFIGLAGVPNVAGLIAVAAAIVSGACAFVYRDLVPRWVSRGALGLGLASLLMLVLTISRGSMGALAVILAVMPLRRFRMTGPLLALALLMVAVVSQTPIRDSGSTLAAAFSRSGSEDEVLTLSGRLDIWKQVIHLIEHSPILGHGYGAGPDIIKTQVVMPWGRTTTSAHNVFLHSALEIGLGTFFIVALFVMQAIRFFRHPDFLRDSFFVLVVVAGMVEPGIAVATNPQQPYWVLCLMIDLAVRRRVAAAAESPVPGPSFRPARAAGLGWTASMRGRA